MVYHTTMARFKKIGSHQKIKEQSKHNLDSLKIMRYKFGFLNDEKMA